MRTEINTNIDVINNRISTACAANNRNVQDITLDAVSKRKNNELIKFALDYGVKNFGENYAQEMKEKSETINSDKIVWHFIGPIQTNKIKIIAQSIPRLTFSKFINLRQRYNIQTNKIYLIICNIRPIKDVLFLKISI